MIGRTIEQKRISLQAMGMSPDRAEAKAESTAVGYLAAIPGLLLCLGAGAAFVLVLLLHVAVTWQVLVALGLLGVTGLLLVALGFSLISRDAAPWIGKAGEWLVNFVLRWRGK